MKKLRSYFFLSLAIGFASLTAPTQARGGSLRTITVACLALLMFKQPSVVAQITVTDAPTDTPTSEPTDAPTYVPTLSPTDIPTSSPTDVPTGMTGTPTDSPTFSTADPTDSPTKSPTKSPTTEPTLEPTPQPHDIKFVAVAPQPTRGGGSSDDWEEDSDEFIGTLIGGIVGVLLIACGGWFGFREKPIPGRKMNGWFREGGCLRGGGKKGAQVANEQADSDDEQNTNTVSSREAEMAQQIFRSDDAQMTLMVSKKK